MADDPLEAAARLLGIDVGELRQLQKQKDRDEVKGIVREVLEDFFGAGDDDDDDGDNLRGATRDAAAGTKPRKPRKPAKDDAAADDDGDEGPVTQPTSIAARIANAVK